MGLSVVPGTTPDAFSGGSQEAKPRHPHAPRTGEEALRSRRVLHQCIMVPQKLLFLKREGLTFCFNPNLQV